MSILSFVRFFINPFKIDIKKYPDIDLRRRKKLLDHHNINKIIDVGANSGQYASQTFKLGFKGEIISFEPLKSVYKKLHNKVKNKQNWTSFNFGLAEKFQEIEINVSKNTFSSSILQLKDNLVESEPASKYISKEKITTKKLDDIFNELYEKEDIVLLKIDVQGYEKNVLDGAKESLSKIKGIQIEMSIEELYEGELLFSEMKQYLNELGYSLYSLENGFYDERTGKLLQVDGIFFRS